MDLGVLLLRKLVVHPMHGGVVYGGQILVFAGSEFHDALPHHVVVAREGIAAEFVQELYPRRRLVFQFQLLRDDEVFVDVPFVALKDDAHARADDFKLLEDVGKGRLQAKERVVIGVVAGIVGHKHGRFVVDDVDFGFFDVSIEHADTEAANGRVVLVLALFAVGATCLCCPCEAPQGEDKWQWDIVFAADVKGREATYIAHLQGVVQELAVVLLYNFEQ